MSAQIRDQLEGQGYTDYVIFTGSGLPVEHAAGVFENDDDRCEKAFRIVQQSTALLRDDEGLKRIIVNFDNAQYIASVTNVQNTTYGVVVRKAVTTNNGPSE